MSLPIEAALSLHGTQMKTPRVEFGLNIYADISRMKSHSRPGDTALAAKKDRLTAINTTSTNWVATT